jgi:hypothetical protein
MRRGVSTLFLLAALVIIQLSCAAQDSDITGDWLLTLYERQTHTGILTLEQGEAGIAAYVEGGPVPITINADEIRFELDYRDGGGRYLVRKLSGKINGNVMEGELTLPLGAEAARWQAERIVVIDTSALAPQPVDLSGVWARTSAGTSKVVLDFTASGRNFYDSYRNDIDDAALRCASAGLVRISGWPYPLEILQSDDRLTILYESQHEVRRIFIDGRDFPDDIPNSAMGYSIGHWEGSTLVVETRLLREGLVDIGGQPLSGNAKVIERMSVSEDGQNMYSDLTLYDEEYYLRPVTRHRSWKRGADITILEYDCDSYSFFRGLALEGRLDEYWERRAERGL